MQRIVVIGNSGAGKSTYAKAVAARAGLAHLDLDTIAWQPASPPTRRPIAESGGAIDAFRSTHAGWIMEGCYADLAAIALASATRLVFLNPGVEACVAHCRARPWESHKYASRSAQDRNLPMLLDWVRGYPTRDDACSLRQHRALFECFAGDKQEFVSPAPLP